MILIAALALGLLAWRGLANDRELAWGKAREEAGLGAERFLKSLEGAGREVRVYDYPPEPGSFDFQAKAPLAELRAQMDLEARTEAGLPVAVLTAFEVAKRSGSVRDGELAYEMALVRWPDLTSPLILERLAELAKAQGWAGDFSRWQDDWEAAEAARDLIRETERLGWFAKDGQLHRIEELGGGSYRHLVLAGAGERWQTGANEGVALTAGGLSLGKAGEVLWEERLENATLAVGVLDPAAVEAEWRSRRNDTLMILALAAGVIGGGSWMMTRGILHEKRSAHARNQFVASVTHELRAPVGAMRLMADALQGGKLNPEKVAEFHGLMARESGRLSVLIENVMDLARVEEGQGVRRVEEVEVSAVVAEVCEMMAMQAGDREITLLEKGAPLTVAADPVVLRQILVNLVDNAVKFSPKGSCVTLDWGEGWWITVADEGPGIAAAEGARVFERFYRGEDELRRKTKGVGIGLSLVKELVELHGGRVMIDDEVAMRVALVESLRSEGYRVEGAEDGEAGLEAAFAGEFDLILLDVMMPKIDGFAACAEMRKRGLKTPVLMLTARGMVDDR
eukprot:maker-scaffold10285_size2227-snap-gene-0.1 protein:Tk12024 transcript:maker-scaffold10285_size2227-snap-gene-0.1-mRNA-1 annotation:"histidine kinase"